MYTIEVTYKTGDSFGSEIVTDVIGLSWDDPKHAIEALKILEDHYKIYQEAESYSGRKHEELLKYVQTKDWFKEAIKGKVFPGYVKPTEDINDALCYCCVKDGKGEWVPLGISMWCGYFESLISAKVVFESYEVKF